ncbi:MAG: glycosyltransferase family 2 protein, partial [Candidatus Tectomicrobia bacterium]|nr:glycosyltransferase family 2 protein [Candidatus Tectomicrobia bacterium]
MPAYNAGNTIESVVERIPSAVRPQIVQYVVVNDGSTDDTAEVLARLQQRLENLVVLQHEENRGYGAAEKTLLRHAAQTAADVVVLLHADGQYAPEEIPRLVEPFVTEKA